MDRTSVFGFGFLLLTSVVAAGVYVPDSPLLFSSGASSIQIADVNADGALDVLRASGGPNEIVWHRNDDTAFDEQTTIMEQVGGVQSVFADDLDGDGDTDVISASRKGNQVAWYSNDIEEGSGFGNPRSIVQRLAGK